MLRLGSAARRILLASTAAIGVTALSTGSVLACDCGNGGDDYGYGYGSPYYGGYGGNYSCYGGGSDCRYGGNYDRPYYHRHYGGYYSYDGYHGYGGYHRYHDCDRDCD